MRFLFNPPHELMSMPPANPPTLPMVASSASEDSNVRPLRGPIEREVVLQEQPLKNAHRRTEQIHHGKSPQQPQHGPTIPDVARAFLHIGPHALSDAALRHRADRRAAAKE